MQEDENTVSQQTSEKTILSVIKKIFSKNDIPFCLFTGVMVLSVIVKLVFKYAHIKSSSYFVAMCVVQLLLYIVPIFSYMMLKKDCTVKQLRINKFSLSCLPLILCSAVLMFFTVIMLKYTSVYFLNLSDNSIKEYFFSGTNVYVIIAGVIIPMICEEALLRGLFLSELKESAGAVLSVIISSLAFAMIHFSSANFLVYFGAGIILGVVTYISGSIIPAILLHGVNNITALFTESAVMSYANENVGGMFAYVFLLVLFLCSLLAFIYVTERFYLKKALEKEEQNSRIQSEKTFYPKILLSPVFIIGVLIFIIFTIFPV